MKEKDKTINFVIFHGDFLILYFLLNLNLKLKLCVDALLPHAFCFVNLFFLMPTTRVWQTNNFSKLLNIFFFMIPLARGRTSHHGRR
jgi:hypothetical protein